ncbi:MAG: SRPBCC family protein [Flavobacteriaceae bacterium]|nr:SRPBCC family protein [Flavobacteriaceae bacterium]
MSNKEYKDWRVVTVCELNAPAAEVWDMVGGFYNINQWHPDIPISEIPEGQDKDRNIRRKLTFPGQPPTWEELVFVDNENMRYKYKWHKGKWGEMIQKYHAQIQVIEKEVDKSCIVQWTSTFYYFEDGLTQFYHNGFDGLIKLYGGKY